MHVSQVEVEPAVAPRGGGGGGHGGGGGGGGGGKIMNKRTYTFVLDIVGVGMGTRCPELNKSVEFSGISIVVIKR